MASADQERQAREQALYLLILQGNNQAAVTLYQNAYCVNKGDPACMGDNPNPQATRTYALQYIAQLADQGITISANGIASGFGMATTSTSTTTGQVGSQGVSQSTPSPLALLTAAAASAAGAGPAAVGASSGTPGVAVAANAAQPNQSAWIGYVAVGVVALAAVGFLASWLGSHHKAKAAGHG